MGISLIPKRKVAYDPDAFQMLKTIQNVDLGSTYAEQIETNQEVKKVVKLVPKRKLVGIDEVTPIVNITQHIAQIVPPTTIILGDRATAVARGGGGQYDGSMTDINPTYTAT